MKVKCITQKTKYEQYVYTDLVVEQIYEVYGIHNFGQEDIMFFLLSECNVEPLPYNYPSDMFVIVESEMRSNWHLSVEGRDYRIGADFFIEKDYLYDLILLESNEFGKFRLYVFIVEFENLIELLLVYRNELIPEKKLEILHKILDIFTANNMINEEKSVDTFVQLFEYVPKQNFLIKLSTFELAVEDTIKQVNKVIEDKYAELYAI